jgi:hypothetical protein
VSTTKRVEWRGDLFASDLPDFMRRLSSGRAIPYDLPHTLTIFLQPRGRDLDVEKTLRIRCYCELTDLSPAAVLATIAREIHGKLQVKERSGTVTELAKGRVALVGAPRDGAEGIWKLKLAGEEYRAMSVRVAQRTHYEIDAGGEVVRLTVDRRRLLFRLSPGCPAFLGDMGPRVEIKAPDRRGVRAAQELVNADGILRRLPYHSLELLFQDRLRRLLDPGVPAGYPEIEAKFAVAGKGLRTLADRMEAWIQSIGAPLLPFPYRIVRMRRYHFCAPGAGGEQRVAVETTAGRISAKSKRGAFQVGPVLVRETRASRTTDIDGSELPPAVFLQERGWRAVNRMDKVQTKIPFRLASGNCYQLSLDDCAGQCGRRLRQGELEYIGSGGASPGVEAVYAELAGLIRAAGLRESALSKYEFFAGQGQAVHA